MTIQLLDIDDVKLDFDNPRIKHVLEHQGPDATEDRRQQAVCITLGIRIRTRSDVLFNCFDVSFKSSFMN